MQVTFSPHFSIRKDKLSIANSLSREEDISGANIVYRHIKLSIASSLLREEDISDANIVYRHLKCKRQDTASVDIIGSLPKCIIQEISSDTLICDLPECIKHKILVYLPIKEAVKTSILSKNWRYTWSTIPNLVVDNSNSHQNRSDEEESRIGKFVNQLLTCHKGNLHKFKLSGFYLCSLVTKTWIKILSQKQINELILEAYPDKFEVIFYINFCLELKVLVLSRCLLYLPLEFDGFKLLHTIDLRDCSFLLRGITELVSICPLLKKLTFKPLYFYEVIIIDSPSLEELTIYGKFTKIYLLTPKLCIVNFATTARTVELRGNLIKLHVYIEDILSYGASCFFLQKYPPSLNYLTMMVMILSSSEYRNYYLRQLFQGVPKLQRLIVYLEPGDPSYVSISYKIQDQIFPCLVEATIIPFFSSVTVFEFAEFILRCAPLLKRLIISCEMKDCEVSKLNGIRKLSTKAEIIFGKSCVTSEGKFEGCCCSMCDIVAW
ncbi:F-box/RNI-like superfamily protein [Rhynchospora pubera]|uniref:F-box/RNI-like superfamily protein n=1 Tax=Rhynchospora pubera TaxID=906938 RepID=A0AAV8G0Y7_9POAL|nr:F-box/RNI-like superfamily protein [Rhynchospora pubera]